MEGNTVDGALHLAKLGYHVFPAQMVKKPDGTIDKPPVRGIMWAKESTTEESTIRAWWGRWPDAVIGVDCKKSGIVVLDVDPRHGGVWTEEGPRYHTVSGGEHVLYRMTEPIGCDNRGLIAPGVDVKGRGGYVVCWAPAEVTDRPTALPACPAVVVRKMLRRDANVPRVANPKLPGGLIEPQSDEQKRQGVSETVAQGDNPEPEQKLPGEQTKLRGAFSVDPFSSPDRTFTPDQAAEYVRREAIEPLRGARPGARNDQLNRSAMVFGHFVPAFWTAEHVTAGLTTIALAVGLGPAETAATIRSGLRAGQREPYALGAVESTEGVGSESVDSGSAVDALLAEMLDTDGLDSIPEPEPLIENFLILDSLASIVGKSGKGKSFVTIDMACHVGTGQRWHGYDVVKGSVVYVVAEGARGIKQRVRAWEKHHGMKATGVKFLPRPVQASSPEWSTLIEACRRLDPVFIVIDTQARVTVGIEENSAKEMGQFIDQAEALRVATGGCVLLVHHTGHNGEEGRGSTAVKGALQSQLSVSKQDHIVQVATLKQKDDVEPEPLILSLFEVEESAVLVGKDEPVRTEAGVEQFVPVPDPEDVFTGHVKALIGVFLSVYREGTGGTRPEVRAHFFELPEMRQLATSSRRKAFDRSWARLEQLGRLARTEGTQRYKFISVDELTGIDV